MKCEKPRTLKDGRVVPCGVCLACRASYSDEWIARFMCEADAFRRGAFFGTLTYNDESLPEGRNLRPKDMSAFWKRVKKRLRLYDVGCRYSYCGEYGTKRNRPHYHFIVCGLLENENPTSEQIATLRRVLSECWQKHHNGSFVYLSEIRSAEASIRYLINYTNKTEGEYAIHVGETKKAFEERTGRVAPFVHYSHGISAAYVEEHLDEIDELDYLEFGGHKFVIPRYFRKKAELARSPSQHKHVLEKIKKHIDETSDELFGVDKPCGYVVDRRRLELVDLDDLSIFLSDYRGFTAKRARIRARYYRKWSKEWMYINGLPPEDVDDVRADVIVIHECGDFSCSVTMPALCPNKRKYIVWRAERDFEYLREVAQAMQENFFPVAWKETLDAWNEFLMRVYAHFEPLYRQRGLNKSARIKNAMERRYVKSGQKNSAHD